MYEFSIAAKYLIPKWRQLSVSIISMVSVLVIAVAVWLIVVFFSVTNGLTTSWVEKLIALTAPVRITPTPQYYRSYYYLIDSISGASGYSLKTIGEKRFAPDSDPYDPSSDEELPFTWQKPDLASDGSLIDPVQRAFVAISQIQDIPGLTANDYEMTMGNLQLQLMRQQASKHTLHSEHNQNSLSQPSYLGSLDPHNIKLMQAIMSPSPADLSNLLTNLALKVDWNEETINEHQNLLDDRNIIRKRLTTFFANATIEELIVPTGGWRLPKQLFPQKAKWEIILVKRNGFLERILIPQNKHAQIKHPILKGYTFEPAILAINNENLTIKLPDSIEKPLPPHTHLYLQEGTVLPVKLIAESIQKASDSSTLWFMTNFSIQGSHLKGEISYGNLQIAKAKIKSIFEEPLLEDPLWMYAIKSARDEPLELVLPSVKGMGEGILLPKGFHLSGVKLGDPGYLSYYAPTISSIQEQRIPVYVAGFYDPGIIPIGAKYVLTSKEITTLIRSFYETADAPLTNGINVRFDNVYDAERVKKEIQDAFDAAGIGNYWKIETYREYEFTRDILQQLQSEKRLYTLLATLIIIVACSNIISMLIILVNDKKLEIGILRSMGATSWSIALIFGSCGVVMGAVGSVLGTLIAFVTLKNIQPLVDLIGWLQGYEMFNPLFYGESLPSEISIEALTFVVFATATISLIAGIIPAIKASLIKPSAILKAE